MDLNPADALLAAPSPDGAALLLPGAEAAPEVDVRFGYRIGSCDFVLDKSLLTEIVVKPAIYAIPHSPIWLCGVINLRGNIISVLDLSVALGTICRGTPGEFVLVVDKGRDALGLVVDAPPRSLSEPQALTTVTPLPGVCADFFQPGVQVGDTRWHQLDVKALAMSLGTTS